MSLNLKIPPVAQGIIAAALTWLCSEFVPLYKLNIPHQIVAASILFFSGGVVALLGVYAFRKMSTTVDPRYPDKASSLVVIGIYRYSRNPMYLGILLVLLGWALFLGAISGLIIPVVFVVAINQLQIKPEEQALKDKFKDSYISYTKSVRRWI